MKKSLYRRFHFWVPTKKTVFYRLHSPKKSQLTFYWTCRRYHNDAIFSFLRHFCDRRQRFSFWICRFRLDLIDPFEHGALPSAFHGQETVGMVPLRILTKIENWTFKKLEKKIFKLLKQLKRRFWEKKIQTHPSHNFNGKLAPHSFVVISEFLGKFGAKLFEFCAVGFHIWRGKMKQIGTKVSNKS